MANRVIRPTVIGSDRYILLKPAMRFGKIRDRSTAIMKLSTETHLIVYAFIVSRWFDRDGDDAMIKTLAANRAYDRLDESILPGRAWGRDDLRDSDKPRPLQTGANITHAATSQKRRRVPSSRGRTLRTAFVQGVGSVCYRIGSQSHAGNPRTAVVEERSDSH